MIFCKTAMTIFLPPFIYATMQNAGKFFKRSWIFLQYTNLVSIKCPAFLHFRYKDSLRSNRQQRSHQKSFKETQEGMFVLKQMNKNLLRGYNQYCKYISL